MIQREEVVLEIQRLENELKAMKGVLRVLDRSNLERRTGAGMRFFETRPSNAIKSLLREGGPQSEESLMKQLEDGGIAAGKKRGMHNTRIAIEKTLRTGALKKINNLIGLPEWSDEMFKKKAKAK